MKRIVIYKIFIFAIPLFLFITVKLFALDNGYEFGEEFQINTTTVGSQESPAIATDGTNYLVTWDINGGHVYGKLFDKNGLHFTEEFQINDYVGDYQDNGNVASNGHNYFVVWSSRKQDGDSDGVFGFFIDNDGNKIGEEFQINTYTSGSQSWTSVASDGNGYMVVWHGPKQSGEVKVYGQLFDNNLNPVGTEIELDNDDNYAQRYPCISSDGSKYLIVWQVYNGVYYEIRGQFLSQTGSFIGESFVINTNPVWTWIGGSIVKTDGNNFLCIWTMSNYTGNDREVVGQLISSCGEKIGNEFQINTYSVNNQSRDSIGFDGNYYLIAWISWEQDGDQGGIYGQLIDRYGFPFGSEFQINSYTTGNQGGSSVSSTGNGFFITWGGEGLTDNDGNGVYGKILKPMQNNSPTITQHPQSVTVYIGEDASFNVFAEGHVNYQWYMNADKIGTNSNSLTLTNLQIENNGAIVYCDITNNEGYITRSEHAVLTILEPSFTINVKGSEFIPSGDISLYTAHARYGSGADFDEYDVTEFVEWSILEPDNCAEIDSTGKLTTYPIDEDKVITIRATLTDGRETHWSDFSVLIDNLFQVTGVTPIPYSILTSAPYSIEIAFNEEIDKSTVNDSTCYLIKAGNDGKFETTDDSYIPVFYEDTSDANKIILDLSDSFLPNDVYQIKLSGIRNINGTELDGEYTGILPSGDGNHGGGFTTEFTVNRRITSVVLDDGTDIIEWASFRDNIVYSIECTADLNNPNWQPLEPAGQWPISETIWTGNVSNTDHQMFFRVVGVVPYIDTVTPSFGAKGSFSLFVDIVGYGTNWSQEDIAVSFGDGITVNSVSVVDTTHISVELRISLTAETGSRDLIIITGSRVYIKENAFEVMDEI